MVIDNYFNAMQNYPVELIGPESGQDIIYNAVK